MTKPSKELGFFASQAAVYEAMSLILDHQHHQEQDNRAGVGQGVGSMGDAEVQQSILEMLVGRHTGPIASMRVSVAGSHLKVVVIIDIDG